MHIHSIPRSNGEPFEGLFEQIVADAGQGDTFRSDAPEDPGRYLHIFELYVSSDRKLVLVVVTLEDWNVVYRDGQSFATPAAMDAYLQNLDPCAHLPAAAAVDASVCRRVRARYVDRCERFLKQAHRRFPA